MQKVTPPSETRGISFLAQALTCEQTRAIPRAQRAKLSWACFLPVHVRRGADKFSHAQKRYTQRPMHCGGMVRGCDAGRHHRSRRATKALLSTERFLPGPRPVPPASNGSKNVADSRIRYGLACL